jgi:hypothetical protein
VLLPVLHHRAPALHKASCAATRASLINVACAKVGARYRMYPVPRQTRRALRRVRSATKACRMGAEISPDVINATCGRAGP